MSANKIVSIVSYFLLGLSALLGVLFYAHVITEEPFIIWAYILLGLAVAITLIFSIANIFQSKENAKKSLIFILIAGVLLLISFLLASSSIPHFLGYEAFDITPGVSKFVGTGLYMTYICGALAFLSIIYSEISSALR
ncbi:MAG: hypothetical protein KAG95_03485 [Bacteroidales bacterium]|nr:hypothetical protein [Bacteroidales bacterium]